MRRREFITLVGAGVLALPLAGRSQQTGMPKIGYLFVGTSKVGASFAAAFRKGLLGTGFVENQNVAIDYVWADNQLDRLQDLVADLVRRRVTLIAATPTSAALAAKAATATIPIVFQTGVDPVALGLVSSFNRPGGNVTGVSQLSTVLGAKRLGLLHLLVPNASVIGMLVDRQGSTSAEQVAEFKKAASLLGSSSVILNGRDLDSVFANLAQRKIDALVVSQSTYFYRVIRQIVLLANRYNVPAIYESHDFPDAGGLVSYGVDFLDVYRQVGVYAGRILGGAKPADLPVIQPTKFELVINLKTAKSLGLDVPSSVLSIADKVIE